MILYRGDNLNLLKRLEDNSIDSVVTDPPYGLSFMNKKWDHDVPSVEFWKEVYRVLKPGGHVLSFGGTRTYHRLVVNIEDAGFEIRDQIMWLYGSGFPKSHNIGKAVDKLQGNERKVVGKYKHPDGSGDRKAKAAVRSGVTDMGSVNGVEWNKSITKGNTEWEGWGTALKPANEPICLARKPLSEKSVALNVLKWGTGGINVDGCRVGYHNPNDLETIKRKANKDIEKFSNRECINGIWGKNNTGYNFNEISVFGNDNGRFPANIILECICDEVIKGEKGEVIEHNGTGGIWNEGTKEPVGRTYNDKGDIHTDPNCPCYIMDQQSGVSKSSSAPRNNKMEQGNCYGKYQPYIGKGHNDSGGASRFFYQAKVSKKERNMGLDGFEEKETGGLTKKNNKCVDCGFWENKGAGNGIDFCKCENPNFEDRTYVHKVKNNHPTVKPVQLMTYLCRLITPPGGTILDAYMGSGSTGIAALLEGFKFIGMEQDEEYFKIAESRINNYEKYREFLK